MLEAPCGGGADLGRDRPRADSDVRWRTLGRARARGVMMAARGRGRVERRARGLRYAGVRGFETQRSLAWTLVARARNGGQAGPTYTGVLTAREPWGTDSDGAILTAGAIGVLAARVGVLT